MIWRRLGLLTAFVAAVAWSWPLLWLWSSDRPMLSRQEERIVALYGAAVRALFAPSKVSGPRGELDGRYLSRSGRMEPWMKRQGFLFSQELGNLRHYHNGADLQAITLCRRFSAGFELCTLHVQGDHLPRSSKSAVWVQDPLRS